MNRPAQSVLDRLGLLGLALTAALLVACLRVVFWLDSGPEKLLEVRVLADQFLSYGEVWLALLMVALALPASVVVTALLQRVPEPVWRDLARFLRPKWDLLTLACLAAFAAFCIAHFVTDYAWFTDDEQAYLFQAKVYLDGALTGRILEPGVIFSHSFVSVVGSGDEARWVGVYPVLQPFLMSISMRFGSANWSQFLAVGVLVYNAGRFAGELLKSRPAGLIAAGLCATSPMLLGLGATYHSSVVSAALSVITARLLLRSLDSPGLVRAIPLGACAGTIVLARPLEGVLVTVALGALLLFRLGSGDALRRPGRVLSFLGYCLGGLIPFAVFLAVNRGTTGTWFQMSYSLLERQIGGFFGFGESLMWGRTHNPLLGLNQTLTALLRMNNWLFAWPVSVLVPLLALMRPFRDRRIMALFGASIVQLTAYFFLAFGSVHDFGSAYHVWHLAWLATSTAWVLLRAGELLQEHGLGSSRSPIMFGAAMSLVGLFTFWPLQLQRWSAVSDNILGPVRAAEAAAGDRPAVVLWTRMKPPGFSVKSWVFRAPAAHESDQILWAFDHPDYYAALKAGYPEHTFFRLGWNGEDPVVTAAELP